MKIKGDDVILESGLLLYAEAGIIGLSPDSEIMSGYEDIKELTTAEKSEIARYMIARWERLL